MDKWYNTFGLVIVESIKLRADKSMEAPPLGLDVWKERLNSPLHACAVWFQRLDDVQVPKKEEVCL